MTTVTDENSHELTREEAQIQMYNQLAFIRYVSDNQMVFVINGKEYVIEGRIWNED
jgi:hypothetical protein